MLHTPCRLAFLLIVVTGCFLARPAFSQKISAGTSHSLFVCSDGSVWASGDNSSGQLGNGTLVSSIIPKQVANLDGVVAVAAGDVHSLALKSDGTVWAWGGDNFGQLGNGMQLMRQDTPVPVIGLNNVIAIATRNNHSLALKRDGTVWAWGHNIKGEVGDGTTTLTATPVPILATVDFKAIAVGISFSMALAIDSTIWVWGNGADGQFGNGIAVSGYHDSVPNLIDTLDHVVKIAAGGFHAMALKGDGTLWAWGRGTEGQLGDGNSSQNSPFPVQALFPPTIIDSIAAGSLHSFAFLTNGDVYAWGNGDNGELGNGDIIDRTFPIPIPTLHNIKTLSGGESHSIGLHQNGTISVWGDNFFGQLGDNSITRKLSPVDLIGLCPTYVGPRDTTYTNYFRPSVASDSDWVAGELSSSIDLPDGKTMWLFGRSKIGHLTGNSVDCEPVHEVHNCIVIQSSQAPSNLETYLNPDHALADSSFFQDSIYPNRYFTPGHGYLHDDSTAYIFLSRRAADGTFLGNNIRKLRKGITTWTLEDINRVIPPPDSIIDFGCAVLVDGNYVYAYGSRVSGTIRLPYLARREFADINAPWEYYEDTVWTTVVANARSISRYNVAEHYSVTKLQGRYYLISHDQAPDTSTCSAHRNIMVYRSNSLTGPFSDPTLAYVAPDDFGGRASQTFNAYAHLAPSGCNALLVSYNVHDTGDTTCTTQCHSGSGFQNADTWRPKFINVPYTLLDSDLIPIISPTANFNFTTSGNTVSFTNSSTGSTAYQWDFGDGGTSTLANPIHTYANAGHLPVTLVAYGCGHETDTATIYIGPGVTIPFPSLGIFPNPSFGQLHLVVRELDDEPITIEVFTALGALRFSQTYTPINGGLDLELDGNALAIFEGAGIYMLRMRNAEQSVTRVLIVGATN